MVVRGGGGERDAGIDDGLFGSLMDLTAEKIEADHSIHLELAPLELGKQVCPTRDEHRASPLVGGHFGRLA
jgi:hypothetical protein